MFRFLLFVNRSDPLDPWEIGPLTIHRFFGIMPGTKRLSLHDTNKAEGVRYQRSKFPSK